MTASNYSVVMRLLQRITVEPGKCGGRPCIRGMRIRVTDILGMLAEGVPHEEILRVRLNRVKQLLTETDLPLEQIAERAGFPHVEYLSVAFRREVGMPPSQFRAKNRP